MTCHKSNGIDGSSIQVSSCILWWVETRFLEPFRDPSYNWFQVLKPKRISGTRISKFQKVYLGMGEVIKLPIGSCGPFYFFWPPIAKIAMCLTKQNPSFWSRPKMMFLPMGHKGRVVPTTTPPLVWPSNGKNKGAPTKILNPTPMEGWI
jgi:hypothetical protein